MVLESTDWAFGIQLAHIFGLILWRPHFLKNVHVLKTLSCYSLGRFHFILCRHSLDTHFLYPQFLYIFFPGWGPFLFYSLCCTGKQDGYTIIEICLRYLLGKVQGWPLKGAVAKQGIGSLFAVTTVLESWEGSGAGPSYNLHIVEIQWEAPFITFLWVFLCLCFSLILSPCPSFSSSHFSLPLNASKISNLIM